MTNRALYIGIYGRTNVGKSTLLNRLTGQQAAIVSPRAGTTTDSVRRRFEIAGVGPVVFVDTAGIDDLGSELGRQRVARTQQTMQEVEAAIFILAGAEADGEEQAFLDELEAEGIPYLALPKRGDGLDIEAIFGWIREGVESEAFMQPLPPLFGSRAIGAGSRVWLVCPIDAGAPAGRLILPQVEALRAALDVHATALVLQPGELGDVIAQTNVLPDLVIADSQVIKEVSEMLPTGVELTSFSALLAEQKGDKGIYTAGLQAVEKLISGSRVLIVENCSHHPSCDDIGRVKLPRWIAQYKGFKPGELHFDFVSGRDPLPGELGGYALIVQCGGCMATRRVIQNRIRAAVRAGAPITNYGMLIRKIRQ